MNRHALQYVDLHPTPRHSRRNGLWLVLAALAGTAALAAPFVVLMLAYFDVL